MTKETATRLAQLDLHRAEAQTTAQNLSDSRKLSVVEHNRVITPIYEFLRDMERAMEDGDLVKAAEKLKWAQRQIADAQRAIANLGGK